MSLKEEALKTISELPDSANIDEIMYRIYVLDKINKGMDDIQNGNFITVQDLKKEIKSW